MRGKTGFAAVLAVLLVSVACGNRLPESELNALAGGAAGPQATIAPVQGAGAPAGTGTTPGAPLTPTTVGSDTGTGTTGEVPAAAPGATVALPASCPKQLSTITIGTVGSQTGIFGGILKPGVDAVSAWATAMNARGGIKCHPVRYIVTDDAGDPSTHQALVRKLVEEEGVQAFVYMDAPLSRNASIDYLNQKRIPVIGGEGGGLGFYTSPMHFPQMTSSDYILEGVVSGVVRVGKAQGKTKYGQVTCIEAALCSQLYDNIEGYAKKYGFQLVYRGQASLTQPDFTSVCQSAQQAGAQMFVMGVDTNSDVRLMKQCASIGYKPIFATGGALATPQLATYPEADGAVIGLPFIPPGQTSHPSIQELASVLKRYAPGRIVDTGTLTGWVSAKLFEKVAGLAADPTKASSILEALWTIRNDDLGGITAPLTFVKNKPAPPVLCYWLNKVAGGKYVDIGDGKRICVKA